VRLSDVDGMDLLVPPGAHRRALDRALRDAGVRWRVAAEVDGGTCWCTSPRLGATVVNGCVRLPPGLRVPVADLPEIRYWAAWRAQREKCRRPRAMGRGMTDDITQQDARPCCATVHSRHRARRRRWSGR
jgi:hypothetical protein